MLEQAFYLVLRFIWCVLKVVFRAIAVAVVWLVPPVLNRLKSLQARISAVHQQLYMGVPKQLVGKVACRPMSFGDVVFLWMEIVLYAALLTDGILLGVVALGAVAGLLAGA